MLRFFPIVVLASGLSAGCGAENEPSPPTISIGTNAPSADTNATATPNTDANAAIGGGGPSGAAPNSGGDSASGNPPVPGNRFVGTNSEAANPGVNSSAAAASASNSEALSGQAGDALGAERSPAAAGGNSTIGNSGRIATDTEATGGTDGSTGGADAETNGGASGSTGVAGDPGSSGGSTAEGGSTNIGGAGVVGNPPDDGCDLPETVSFQQDLQPFLIPSCGGGNGCHVIDDSSTMANGGYNHAYDWLTAGAHTESCPDGPFRFEIVVDVVNEAHPASCANSRKMPPPDETGDGLRTPLTPCQVAALQTWVNEPPVTQSHRPDDTSPSTPYPMPPFN